MNRDILDTTSKRLRSGGFQVISLRECCHSSRSCVLAFDTASGGAEENTTVIVRFHDVDYFSGPISGLGNFVLEEIRIENISDLGFLDADDISAIKDDDRRVFAVRFEVGGRFRVIVIARRFVISEERVKPDKFA